MRHPSLSCAAAAVAAVLAAPLAARAQQPAPAPAQLLPAGRTLAYIEVGDLDALAPTFERTDIGQAWQTLRPFYENLVRGLEAEAAARLPPRDFRGRFVERKEAIRQEIGIPVDDALAVLKGGFAVAILDAPAPGANPDLAREPAPVPVGIFPARAKATIAAFLEKNKENGPPLRMAEHDGAVFLSMGEAALAAPAGPAALASDAGYKAIRAKAVGGGEAVVFAYVNTQPLLRRAALRDPDAAKILDTLGLSGMRGAALALSLDAGQLREAFVISAPGERRGLLKLLDAGTAPVDFQAIANVIPGDVASLGIGNVDLASLYDQGIALAKALEGHAGRIDREIAEVEEDLGFKIRDDFLAPLGSLWVAESLVPQDGVIPESVFSVTIKDAAKLQKTLGEVAQKLGFAVKALDRGDRTLCYFQAPLGKIGEDPTRGMTEEQLAAQAVLSNVLGAWTIDRGRFYMADSVQALDERFAHLEKGALADSPAFKEASAAMAPGARSFGWAKIRGAGGMLYHLALRGLRFVEPMARHAGIPVDAALLPQPAVFAKSLRPSHGSLVIDADGIALVSHGGVPVLTVVPIVAAIAIPNLIEARRSDNELAAIVALRTLATAQALYRESDKDGNGKLDYAADLEELARAGLVDPALASGMKQGYRFTLLHADENTWSATAVPIVPGMSGERSFFVDESGVIRYALAPEQATAESTPLGE